MSIEITSMDKINPYLDDIELELSDKFDSEASKNIEDSKSSELYNDYMASL